VPPSPPRCLPAANPGPLTGQGTNTWLIDGEAPTLIDAGAGMPSHVEAIAEALGARPLARVLVTHGHPDHAAGLPALRARWPGLDARKMVLPGEAGWTPIHDGDVVRAGDATLVAIHTPGHASDHLCFWDAADRALYAGDMVILGTTVMIPAGRGGNLNDYLASLARMASLDPARIYPGHGPIIERPLDAIREYVDHRRAREAQILAARRRVGDDVEALVSAVYAGLPDALRPAARMTIQAHLEKLAEDGRLE
jgi:glyoxylase-like metal-dependent hydrolase (beta-lactamase superfamily II)